MKRKRKTTMAKGTGFFSLFKKKGKAKTVSQVALHDAKDILDSSSGKPFGDVYKLGSKVSWFLMLSAAYNTYTSSDTRYLRFTLY